MNTLNWIKKAGFQEVKIINETTFPIEYMNNDSTEKSILENSNMTHEKVKEIASSAESIKIFGIKPKK
jgi:hypothetical protein